MSFPFYFSNVDNATFSGLDLAYTGPTFTGIGIWGDSSSDNLTIENVVSTNRSVGIQINGGGTDLVLNNNDLSNNYQGLYVDNVSDGGDSDSAPLTGTGNVFRYRMRLDASPDVINRAYNRYLQTLPTGGTEGGAAPTPGKG